MRFTHALSPLKALQDRRCAQCLGRGTVPRRAGLLTGCCRDPEHRAASAEITAQQPGNTVLATPTPGAFWATWRWKCRRLQEAVGGYPF